MERFLSAVRAYLVLGGEAICETPAILRLGAAVAAQCFINEYVFPTSGDLDQASARLRARVEQDLLANQTPDEGFRARCILLAMTQPLLEVDPDVRAHMLARLEFLYGRATAEAAMPELERILKVHHAHKPPELVEYEAALVPGQRAPLLIEAARRTAARRGGRRRLRGASARRGSPAP